MEAKLVVIGGKANMGEVKLRLPMTIGRGNKADLMISHPTVSREHCRLFEKNGELVIQDNGSSNGTFVDGEKIDKAVVVQPGQILAIGPLTFRAEYEAPTSHVSRMKAPDPLADTQAIDSDELDLDFLLDDDAPAKPAPAKPKVEKKVEAKAPAVAPGKPAKNAPPEAKEKKSGSGAPTIQEPAKPAKAKSDADKSPKIGPPTKEVNETSEIDVDFLLDDLAEEQKQAPASKDTSEIDLSDLGLDEPVAKAPAAPPKPTAPPKEAKSPKVAPPAAKAPAPAPKADDFEQTIDFSGIGDDDEKPSAAAPMEDLLPSDDVKPGDIDFDFLSDLDDVKPAAAANIVEPPKKADAPKIAPPPAAAKPAVEPPVASDAAASDEFDLNDMFGDLDLPAADEKVAPGAVDWEPKAEAAPTIESPEASAPPEAASEADFDLDDFLSDVDVASSEPASAALEEVPSLAPAESSEVALPEPEAEKPEFDFSAMSETQDVVIGPPAEAAVDEKTVEISAPEAESPIVEARAEAPAEDSASATVSDFDFLDDVDVTPVAEAPPVVDATEPSKSDDFSFLDDLEEKPAVAAELPSMAPAEASGEKEPDFSAFAEPEAGDTKAADVKESAEDSFAFLDAEAPAAAKIELPPAAELPSVTPELGSEEKPSEEPSFEATLNFDALDLDSPAADVAEAPIAESPVAEEAKPAAEFDFDAFVIDEVKVEPAAAAPAAEDANFDFLADVSDESKVETVQPSAKQPADDFDFLAADDAVAPTADLDATAMFSAAEPPAVDAPAASAAQVPEFNFDSPQAPAAEFDFESLEAAEAKAPEAQTESEAVVDFDMFASPTSDSEAVAEAKPGAEPEPISFAPAAKATPSSPVAKKPAAKGPSLLDKVKLLFGGSKKASPKKGGAKKSGPVAPAARSGYQPVIANPVKPIDAPIPLDDAPIPLDDFAPADASPGDSAATEMFSGLASPETPAVDTPGIGAADALAPDFGSESPPLEAAAGVAPAADFDATAMFDTFAVDAPVADAPSTDAPAAEANVAPAKESADDMFDDFLSDLGSSETPAAESPVVAEQASAAPSWSEASEAKPADEAAEFDFNVDELAPTAESEVAATEWSLESPEAESPIAESANAAPPAADQLELDFLSEELTASLPEATADATEQQGAVEPVGEQVVEPTAEVAPPTAPRRPAHIDVDLRMSSSLRPLARVHLQRPRHDVPEMEPEEPAGRNFTPRAKAPTTPNAAAETPADASAAPSFESFDSFESPPESVAPDSALAASADGSSFEVFDFGDDASAPPAETASDSAASLGDADFDFLTKEQEAEAVLDQSGTATPAETPAEAQADLFADLESVAPPAPAEQEEEFVISLDELSDEPSPAETAPSANGAAATDTGLNLDFLDLEVSEEAPIVDGLEVLDIVEESPAESGEEEKNSSQPVTAKKAPADEDAELADFLRDLGMN
ncbi:MAG: hypothetical protein C0483_13095 [Pirellula sp.]|nr:hypothetical protein [Pirellula sp.]